MNKQIQAVKPVSASSKVSTKPASKPVAKSVQATKQASKATTTTTAQKPASKPATSPVFIACRLVDKLAKAYFAATVKSPSKYHFGRFVIDSEGNIKPSPEGKKFFSNRLTEKEFVAIKESVLKAMSENKPIKSGVIGSREWLANSAFIQNKAIALPVFTGAGDKYQQYAFAHVITSGM